MTIEMRGSVRLATMWIYLDNSAINDIVDDPDRDSIIERLRALYVPRLSMVNVIEIALTPYADRRGLLCDVARRLFRGAPLLADPGLMINRHLKAFASRKANTNVWGSEKDQRQAALILRHSDKIEGEVTQWVNQYRRSEEAAYNDLFMRIREHVQQDNIPFRIDGRKPTLARFIRLCWADKSLLRGVMNDVLRSHGFDTVLAGKEFKIFGSNEFWPMLLTTFGIALYNRGFQVHSFSARKNAGYLDGGQVVYLPYTDIFVTSDVKQRKVIRFAARIGRQRRLVLSYEQLRRFL
jgi:hypothetical protein